MEERDPPASKKGSHKDSLQAKPRPPPTPPPSRAKAAEDSWHSESLFQFSEGESPAMKEQGEIPNKSMKHHSAFKKGSHKDSLQAPPPPPTDTPPENAWHSGYFVKENPQS